MRLSDPTAKGKLTAYQRWEMTSFEDSKPIAKRSSGDSTSAQLAAAHKSELDQLRLKAQKEGVTKGFEEGYQAGLNTGQAEAKQILQQEIASFKQIGTQFSLSIQQAEQNVAQDVLDLALDLAKAMLKSALEINPEHIIPIVEQAIASLPSVQQPAHLFLHPRDAELVKAKIGPDLIEAGWVIVGDQHLKQGDCRIETKNNQINAALSSRWHQLAEALGRDNQWYGADISHAEHRK